MASANQCLASLARLSLSTASRPAVASSIPKFLLPSVSTSVRFASNKRTVKKKKTYKTFRVYDRSSVRNWALCDAIRYVRAFEVGHNPTSVKYDLAVKLKSLKGGGVVRNRIRLPHPVGSDTRIGVVCPEDSELANEARALGAVAVGEETLFEQIRMGNIPFNKLICYEGSEAALKKAALGKILGPKGMMPNLKTRTITKDVLEMMREIAGASEYRERNAVVRLAIAQLGFTPEMVSDNVKAFMSLLRSDLASVEGKTPKTVDEVVLSATHSPGFSLNGAFASTDENLHPKQLATVM